MTHYAINLSELNRRVKSSSWFDAYTRITAAISRLMVVAGCGLMLAGCQSVGQVSNMGVADDQQDFAQKGSLSNRGASRSRRSAESKNLRNGARQNIASLTEIVRRDPQDVNALNMRGTAFARARQYNRALADFNAAIDMDPQYYQAYANRALVHVSMKRFDLAKGDYEQALRLSPEYTAAYLGRGRLFMRNKNYAMALADFRRAIKLNPSSAMAYFQRGSTYQLMGQHENAVSDFDVAIGLKPNTPDPYFSRGQSRFALQKYELAYDDFYVAAKRGKGRGRSNARAWTYRGLSAERFGDPKKAVRAYRRALQASPRFKPALEGMKRLGVRAA